MKVLTIEYSKTKGLDSGKFGSESIGMVAQIEDGDSPEGVLDNLQGFVNSRLGIAVAQRSTQLEMDLDTVKAPVSKGQVKEEPKKEAPKKEAPKKTAKKPVKKAAAPKTEEKKAVKKAVKKAANVPYDRTLKPHRTIFIATSKDIGINKDVMNDEEKRALKETSLFMEGKDMFEAGSTEVLQDFKDTAVHQFKDFLQQFSVEV